MFELTPIETEVAGYCVGHPRDLDDRCQQYNVVTFECGRTFRIYDRRGDESTSRTEEVARIDLPFTLDARTFDDVPVPWLPLGLCAITQDGEWVC